MIALNGGQEIHKISNRDYPGTVFLQRLRIAKSNCVAFIILDK